MGYEEGKEFYEGLHMRRSKGLAPMTKYALDHQEIEDSIRNRETAAYNKWHTGSCSFSRPSHTRRYNVITNEQFDYLSNQL